MFMKILVLICRILLGLGFVVFGANILHPFLPMPPMDPAAPATQWQMLMMASGWMKVIGAAQLLGGLLVLIGGTLPAGLCILAPVLVNILCFHAFFMGGKSIGAGLVFTLLWFVLLYAYRASFAGIFTTKAAPTA
jgi:putative oxidoreductase